MAEEHPNWYALRVRSRFEKSVQQYLQATGYQEYLPLYRKLSRWSDRDQMVQLPLFPGYVFCQFEMERRLPVLQTPGVVHIVSSAGIPIPVPEAELVAVRRLLAAGKEVYPYPNLVVGQPVRISHGAFAGVEGHVVGVKRHYRLVVSISLLQRSVGVEIDRASVAPLSVRNVRARPQPETNGYGWRVA